MPEVIEQPRLLNPSVSAMPASTGVALMAVTGILSAPADQPCLADVVKNVTICLQAMQVRLPQAVGPLANLASELETAAQGLSTTLELHQPAGMIGRISTHRAWAVFTSNFDQIPVPIAEVLGIEFARSYLTQQDFSVRIAADMHHLLDKSSRNELTQDDSDKLENQVLSLTHRVRHVFKDRGQGLDAATTAFNARVVATITAQSSSMRVDERRAAGTLHELSAADFAVIAKNLHAKVKADDAPALQTVLAYCLGLPWELSKRVPFFTGTSCASVVWINPSDQCIYVNFERVFPGLSKKNAERHVQTTLVLVIPLPLFVGSALFSACSANPGLEDIGALADDSLGFSRSVSLGADTDAAIRLSIARLIASRAGVALRAGVTKDLVCYATVSLSQINMSDHHYLTKKSSSIWQACEKIYQSVGWGPCVPDPNKVGPAFGSRVTPEAAWVRELIEEHLKAAVDMRPSKRYRLESLIAHHNAFARYVALLMTILIGGRNRTVVSFDSHTWRESGAFVQHGDKLVGPLLGLTPLPISARSSAQLGLWRVHLNVLDQRLKKLNIQDGQAARVLIRSILARESVNMIFVLDGQAMPHELNTESIFMGKGRDMNGDFSRHFMTDPLMEEGLPFEFVQQWLRHHVEGNSPWSITAAAVPSVSLSAIAQALDRIALNLGLHPIHGIARTA
jgi:hypothetical protein